MSNKLVPLLFAGILLASAASPASGQLTEKRVLDSIDRGKKYLLSQQRGDGSWRALERENFPVGVSSLALMALINCGMTTADEPVQRALGYLRSVNEPTMTYEIALMIMALTAAKDGGRDGARLISLVHKLETSQIKQGDNSGSWGYGRGEAGGNGDRSNAQFAILGLREAAYAGVPVERQVWERARNHWVSQQAADGGWGYSGQGNGKGTGSMTVAGIATMTILESMLRDADDENPDGSPKCCGGGKADNTLERALAWMDRNFSVRHNPGGGSWLLYYLYGLERAGRLSGRRFFGQHDWYREGAEFLIQGQSLTHGSWKGEGLYETDTVVGSSLALLFLSKGLAPVLINKLKYGGGPQAGSPWNLHTNDVRNMTEYVSGLKDWPKLLTWQEVDLGIAAQKHSVQDLLQAPILFFNGSDGFQFSPDEIALLREYVGQGGFILAEAGCDKQGFDASFRELVRQMYPDGDHPLKKLGLDHPVFRTEFLLNPDSAPELWGVDVGCRTSIMYSPQADLACLWDKWAVVDPPKRSEQLSFMITKAARMGTNIVAYATGREILNKIGQGELADEAKRLEQVHRGALEIAKIRHTGGWDAAPQALTNLLRALNTYSGAVASTRAKPLLLTDPNLLKYPLVYMHGRNSFQFGQQERDRLRAYLTGGGMLFADACCGAPQFDKSFREMVSQVFPDQPLTRIPANHEMFTDAIGHNLPRVTRREPLVNNANAPLRTNTIVGEPYLEGIEIDGRYVVIYSKYDISCALERQAAANCSGYVHEDAVKIAVNVVLYSLLQ